MTLYIFFKLIRHQGLFTKCEKVNESEIGSEHELDRVGLVDKRPFTDCLHHLKNVRHDM